MYTEQWGLAATPFTNIPDRRWFFESATHEEALARLLFLVEENRRCGVIYGPAGTGKSLLLQVLKGQLQRTPREWASVDLLGRTPHEFLWELTGELGLPQPANASQATMWRTLQDHLIGNQVAQAQTVLIFDHVERAGSECWDQLARLIHVQEQADRWTTIVLSVRDEDLPRYGDRLREWSDLRIELPPLDRAESQRYITHLVEIAGGPQGLFTAGAMDRVFELSGGIPRDINRLCDLALLAALAEQSTVANEQHVLSAADDLGALANFRQGSGSRLTSAAY